MSPGQDQLALTDRRRSLAQAATGAALFGAGQGGSELLDRRLKRKGGAGPYKAVYRRVVHPGHPSGFKASTHLPHIAGKLGVRGAQAVGLPMAAYGAYNAARLRPKKTRALDVREDVLRPVAAHAVYHDQVLAGQAHLEDRLNKALTPAEQRSLNVHRQIGRRTSQVGGTLGLAALAVRSPSGAKVLVNRGAKGARLVRLAAREPAATKLSNTLGVGAIGTGAAGSFNYAAQQKLERKAAIPGVKSAAYEDVDERTPHRDRFLRGYSSRISPEAERGYRHLKEGRNRQAAAAAGGATMAGLGGWLTHHELTQPKVARPAAAIAAAGALASLGGAAQSAHGAYRWNRKMGRIKAKARSRRAQGLYGPGRGLSPVDTSSVRATNLAKAFRSLRPKIGMALQYDRKVGAHMTMDEKLRRHALEARQNAGSIGHVMAGRSPAQRAEFFARPGSNKYGSPGPMTQLESRRELKMGAQGLYDALGRSGRGKRVLP